MAAIILGFTDGITPGPIILTAFSEILKSPKGGLFKGGKYLLVAALTEFCIALFLVTSSKIFSIPEIVFKILSFLGAGMLIYIGIIVLKIKSLNNEEKKENVKPWHIFVFMVFNGPMWLFWISVYIPEAHKMNTYIAFSDYLFVIIFEIFMIIGLDIIIYGFYSFRKLLLSEKFIKNVFRILSILIFLVAAKILYSSCEFIF